MYSEETIRTVIRNMCEYEKNKGKVYTIHRIFCAIDEGNLREVNRLCYHGIEMELLLYCINNGIETVDLSKAQATKIIREYVISIYERVKWVL